MVDEIQAASAEELWAELKRVDISVPARTDGRTTHDTETWTICRLLSTLAKAEHLCFPLRVVHRDRPDFEIDAGSRKAGIEITEAITQQFAAYCALAERECPDALLELAHFGWDAPNRTTEEMRALLCQSQLTSDGFAGDRPEQDWARFILSTVDSKLAKLARPDFTKFDENWLSIYDNLPLPDIFDLDKAIAFLRPLLQDRWSRTPSFHVVFVEHGAVIAKITASGSENLVLNDIWN
jgi:hypothetical protein